MIKRTETREALIIKVKGEKIHCSLRHINDEIDHEHGLSFNDFTEIDYPLSDLYRLSEGRIYTLCKVGNKEFLLHRKPDGFYTLIKK